MASEASLQCPHECQRGQRWWGRAAVWVCLGAQDGLGILLQHGGCAQALFSSLLPWELSRPWEVLMWVCSSWVMLLSCAFLLTAPQTGGWPLSLELRTVTKSCSAHPLGGMLGFPDTTLTARAIFSSCLPGNKCLSPCFPLLMPTFLCIKLSSQVKCLELPPFTRMWVPHGLLAVSCRNTPFPRKELHDH